MQVRYGRLNPATRSLDFPAFRPVEEGEQVFISYGPCPNLKLLAYYGFSLAENPHDLVLLQLEVRSGSPWLSLARWPRSIFLHLTAAA